MTFQKDMSVPGTHPREPVEMKQSDPLPLDCNCTWQYTKNVKALKYINMSCPIHTSLAQRDQVRHIYIQDWQELYEKNHGKKKVRGRPRKEIKDAGATVIITGR